MTFQRQRISFNLSCIAWRTSLEPVRLQEKQPLIRGFLFLPNCCSCCGVVTPFHPVIPPCSTYSDLLNFFTPKLISLYYSFILSGPWYPSDCYPGPFRIGIGDAQSGDPWPCTDASYSRPPFSPSLMYLQSELSHVDSRPRRSSPSTL